MNYSDSRWNEYNNGKGLSYYVHSFNIVDGAGGILLLIISLYLWYAKKSLNTQQQKNAIGNGNIVYILVLLFRDACLWRETVEYMMDQHLNDYPFTISQPTYLRKHAIFALWSVNFMWLTVPLFTVVWTFQQITHFVQQAGTANSGKNGKKRR